MPPNPDHRDRLKAGSCNYGVITQIMQVMRASSVPREAIHEQRSAGDQRCFAHLMQFPRVGVVRGHLRRVVIK
jgi:hypothetical protein